MKTRRELFTLWTNFKHCHTEQGIFSSHIKPYIFTPFFVLF